MIPIPSRRAEEAKSGWAILAIYACISSVYLLYRPHALPVSDDWTNLQSFQDARQHGMARALLFLGHLADNAWWAQFRLRWVSFMPAYALSFIAGFAGWPYFLLGWTAHLLSAFLLCRTVSLLSRDLWTGFAAGAIYSVFPACNHVLFWPQPDYYFPALAFCWWFCYTWRRVGLEADLRYTWKDFVALLPVLFSSEQVLAALVLLVPVSYVLFGSRERLHSFVRFWLAHMAALVAALACYVLFVNRVPIARSFGSRYDATHMWNPSTALACLAGSLGVNPAYGHWRPQWRLEPVLVVTLLTAAASFLWASRRAGPSVLSRGVAARLFLWSAAGAALTYLPVGPLKSFEVRYLYDPALFLPVLLVAAAGCFRVPVRVAVALLAVAYGVALSYLEMRQCWIPQSRAARAFLEAVAEARPIHSDELLVFAGGHSQIGFAPSFITGAGWSLKSALALSTGVRDIRAGRDLIIDPDGNMALYRSDSLVPVAAGDFDRLRVFVLDSNNRFAPKRFVAVPAPDGRFALQALRPLRAEPHAAGQVLTSDELKALPFLNDIYIARRTPTPIRASQF